MILILSCLSAYFAAGLSILLGNYYNVNKHLLWCCMTAFVACVALLTSRFGLINIMTAVYAFIVCHAQYSMNKHRYLYYENITFGTYWGVLLNSLLCAVLLVPMQICLSFSGQESMLLIVSFFILLYFFTALITLQGFKLSILSKMREDPVRLYTYFLFTNCLFAILLLPSTSSVLCLFSPVVFLILSRYQFIRTYL